MNRINEMRLTFEAQSQNEGFARVAVAGFVMSLNPTAEELADIKTAVSEAVTNCIVHAYGDDGGKIRIHTVIFEDRSVRITVSDRGCGIDDINMAMEPMYTTGNKLERAGLGFAVMKAFTDKLRVTSKKGNGTTVTMVKKLGG